MPDYRVEWYDDAPPDRIVFASAATAKFLPEPLSPGARAAIAWLGRAPVARLAIYQPTELHGADGPSGMIGNYGARDVDAAVALLGDASRRLFGEGARRVVGPMNGSTWARYRLALPPEPGDPTEPPFFTEPLNPPEYPAHFERAGFAVAALYESRIAHDLSVANPRATEGERLAAERGVRIEPIRMDRFDGELRDMYQASLASFADNLYYTPIAWEQFHAMYAPLRDRLDPDMVLLARARDGTLAGFALAFADAHVVRGGRPWRVVVKSLASLPAWRGIGLAGLLVDRVRAVALAKGYGAVIHALMQAANKSIRISTHTARVFRRYALYARDA